MPSRLHLRSEVIPMSSTFHLRGALATIAILVSAIFVPSAQSNPIIFDNHVEYSTGPSPRKLTLADLNGDDRADIATGNLTLNTNEVSVLLNLGDGTFGTATQYATGANSRSPAAGDVDGDGDRDLVVGLQSGDFRVAVLLNDGLASFGPPELLAPLVGLPDGPVVVDLDQDEDRDIVFSQAGGEELVVLINQGGGAFAPHVTYGGVTDAYFSHLSVGDVDADDDPDVVIGRSLSGVSPSLYRNRGDGTFDSPQPIPVEQVFNYAGNDLGDLDLDGDLDLVLVSEAGHYFLGMRNDGTGSFSSMGPFPSGVETQFGGGVTVADLDGDQRADVIIPGANTYRIATHRSNGAGGFDAPEFHALGGLPTDVAAGNLDSDDGLDLGCGLPHEDQVSVLLNRSETTAVVGPALEAGNPASLGPAFSNPAGRLGTTIPYVLAEPAQVRISVLDVAGRQVRSLLAGERPAGRQAVNWDGRADSGARVAAGVYLIELNAGEWRRTARVVVAP
jgi:hypothetical protein